MERIKYRISLDMFEVATQTTIKAKKGDTACSIHITLTENGKIYNITDGCYAVFSAKKPNDDHIYNSDTCYIKDNVIIYDFTEQTASCEGVVECEVILFKDGQKLTSPCFNLVVDGTVYNGEEIVSSTSIDVFEQMVEEIKDRVADEIGGNGSTAAVSYSEEQNLTSEQKETARNNINAVDAGRLIHDYNEQFSDEKILTIRPLTDFVNDILNHASVLVNESQNLMPQQQEQARKNIGAVSQENQYIATPTTELSQRLGEELATANGWTLDGWTGDFANGFTHTVGSTGKLTYTLGNTGTKTFYLEFDVAVPDGTSGATSSAFTVTIGNSPRFIAYNGGGSKHYVFGIKSVEDGNLEFIPTLEGVYNVSGGNFNGTISNISLKEVVADAEPTIVLKDADGNVYEEKRILFDSVYVGKNSGAKALRGGELNTAFGENALFNNTTGYWNTAMGWNALYANTVGSRNVALGKMALERNVSGDRNVGIGSFALCRNTDGRNNIAIGADSLWMNTTGERNIALGLASLGENIVGSDNIALGNGAGSSINGDFNIVLGRSAMSAGSIADMKHNIAIGAYALYKNQGHRNVAIGHEALYSNSTGNSNVAIGMGTLKASVSGIQNVAIGWDSGKAVTTGNNNIFVGYNSGIKVTTGQENILIGVSSGGAITSGRKNVVIGYSANSSANAQNTIAIGYGATATKNNSVVIGNDSIVETLLKGDLVVRGTDGTKRKIVFNTDGTCAWSEVT